MQVQVQEMSKELEIRKEQKVVWQGVANELQEMSKVDVKTLILEKVISDPNDNQVHIWNKSINWKVINISKGIVEFEKSIAVCGQTKVKVSNEVVIIITGGATMSDLQHVDCQFLLDSFSVRIHSKIENRVSDAETLMKLSLFSVTLEDCIISIYQQELEEIQDKYFTTKIRMENVFISNYDLMVSILDTYMAFKNTSITS